MGGTDLGDVMAQFQARIGPTVPHAPGRAALLRHEWSGWIDRLFVAGFINAATKRRWIAYGNEPGTLNRLKARSTRGQERGREFEVCALCAYWTQRNGLVLPVDYLDSVLNVVWGDCVHPMLARPSDPIMLDGIWHEVPLPTGRAFGCRHFTMQGGRAE
jgi:hypothetical protein